MKRLLLLFAVMSFILLFASCEHEHTFGEWAQAVLPTCTSEGVAQRICACGEVEEKTIPMAEHLAGEASCTRELICTVCGEVLGPKLDHVLEEPASCTDGAKCSVCQKTVQIALGHEWVEASCKAPKTCERCKLMTGVRLKHEWEKASDSSATLCKLCGVESLGYCISGDAEEAKAAKLHYSSDEYTTVGGSVTYSSLDSGTDVTWEIDDAGIVNIKDYPVMLVLTANLCTCDIDRTCYWLEECEATLTVGSKKTDPVDMEMYGVDRDFGIFSYFYCDLSDASSDVLSGRIDGIQFTVNGEIRQNVQGRDDYEVYFVGFFKTLEEADKCALSHINTRWATEE